MPPALKLATLNRSLVDATNEHLARHVLESGRHGVHWVPYDPTTRPTPPSLSAASLERAYDEVGWERWTVVAETDNRIVGHVSLTGASFGRGLHRCELGMGLERPYWRQGLGHRLLSTAVQQARSIPTVDWLDLRVLGSNGPAIALYLKHGFEEIARVPDFCRIEGRPEDDVLMTLRVAS